MTWELRWRRAIGISVIVHMLFLAGAGYLAARLFILPVLPEPYIELELASEIPAAAPVQAVALLLPKFRRNARLWPRRPPLRGRRSRRNNRYRRRPRPAIYPGKRPKRQRGRLQHPAAPPIRAVPAAAAWRRPEFGPRWSRTIPNPPGKQASKEQRF